MAIKIGNGSSALDLASGSLGNGISNPLQKVYVGNGSESVRVWQSFTPYAFYEGFNTNGSLSSYGTWVLYQTGGVTWQVASGEAGPSTVTTDGTYGIYARHVNEVASDYGVMQARIAQRNPTTQSASIFVNANDGMTTHVGFRTTTTSGQAGIYTRINGVDTMRTTFTSPSAWSVKLTVENWGTHRRFAAWADNGTGTWSVVGIWNDTTGVVPAGPGYRYCGMHSTMRRSLYQNTLSNGWDDIFIGDNYTTADGSHA